jgi:predicted Zn-dependent protease
VAELFQRVLSTSTADETELVWFERRNGNVGRPEGAGAEDFLEEPRLTVLVRVVDGKRIGWHRAETPDFNALESGVRQAQAVSKVQPREKRLPVMPHPGEALSETPTLYDPRIAELDPRQARELLEGWCGDGARGRLSWSETRVAVFNSHGLKRHAATTEVTLRAVAGHGVGAGRASASARSLEALAPETIFERARGRSTAESIAELPAGSFPVWLGPEAVTELLNVLNIFALSGRAYLDGTSFLAKHRNVQVFDRTFHLRDDGTDAAGVPFPFDLEGSPKAPVQLIAEGSPSTPALDRAQGAQAGLQSTAQAVGGGDSLFGNLFLAAGEAGPEELAAAAEGGLFIPELETPECFDPAHLRVRAHARGVRRVEGGKLGPAVGDVVWEESLLAAFARLRAVGTSCIPRVTSSTPLGALSAPDLVLMESEGFTPRN